MAKFLDDHELLAKEPDAEALYYAHALLLTKSEEGLSALSALAEKGSVMALLYIANELKLKGKDKFTAAEEWYRAAYKKMSATALLNLALIYCDTGRYDEAKLVWKDGASNGDAPSMYWLANLYLSQCKGKENEAIILLEKANSMGQLRAAHDLAMILIRDRRSIRDVVRGLALYCMAIVKTLRIAYRNPTSRRLW